MRKAVERRDADATEVFTGFAQDKKRSGKLAVSIGVVIVLLLLGYVTVAAAVSGSVPRGTSFAGVDVGGMDPTKAIKKLDAELGQNLSQPFAVKLGAKTAKLNPLEAGLKPDFFSSVHEVADFSLHPSKVMAHIFGAGPTALRSQVNRGVLDKATAGVAAKLRTPPTEANFLCQDGKLQPIGPAQGWDLQVGEAAETLAQRWWEPKGPLELPGARTEPKSTKSQLTKAQDGPAKVLMSAPVKMNIADKKLEVSPEEICRAATWTLNGKELEPSLDGKKLRDFTLKSLSGLETEPVDARFSFESGAPQVINSVDGKKLDPEELSGKVTAGAVSPENREVTVDLTPIPPNFSTEDAKKAGVKEILGEFATPLTADTVRTGNLRNGARILTGLVIGPGEEFSLEKSLGPITAENGWAKSGVIENGVHTTAMGGGLSQMCVTALNAAWFSGMDLVEFHPHSVWLTRYPMGRECTLWTGSLDLKWKNSTPNSVALQSWVSGGQLHVRIWGTKYYEVKTSQSPRSRVVPPGVKVNNWSGCVSSGAGQSGFTISNTRTRFLNGKEVDSKTYTHTYAPDDEIVCARDLERQKAQQEKAEKEKAQQQQSQQPTKD